MSGLEPLPPGRYTVVVLDDTTVQVTEGPFAGRTLKTPSWSPLPKELRTAKVDVALEEVDTDTVRNSITEVK